MLYRIVMNVVSMTHAILVIPYLVFPKAALPDIPFSLHDPALIRGALQRIIACPQKYALDQHPTI